MRPDLYDFAKHLRDAQRLHSCLRAIGLRGEQMVLSAQRPTVNNSLYRRPRRGETHPEDVSILWEKQKRPVTAESNVFGKERCRN